MLPHRVILKRCIRLTLCRIIVSNSLELLIDGWRTMDEPTPQHSVVRYRDLALIDLKSALVRVVTERLIADYGRIVSLNDFTLVGGYFIGMI